MWLLFTNIEAAVAVVSAPQTHPAVAVVLLLKHAVVCRGKRIPVRADRLHLCNLRWCYYWHYHDIAILTFVVAEMAAVCFAGVERIGDDVAVEVVSIYRGSVADAVGAHRGIVVVLLIRVKSIGRVLDLVHCNAISEKLETQTTISLLRLAWFVATVMVDAAVEL